MPATRGERAGRRIAVDEDHAVRIDVKLDGNVAVGCAGGGHHGGRQRDVVVGEGEAFAVGGGGAGERRVDHKRLGRARGREGDQPPAGGRVEGLVVIVARVDDGVGGVGPVDQFALGGERQERCGAGGR